MGAIIGKLSFDPEEILAGLVLERMLDATARSAVDARGVYAAPGIALGWCGAACRDAAPSLGTSTRDRIRAVADAELTNAAELRAELEHVGSRFHQHTDGELIAHAYDRWGTHAFERLSGPFACAIWDQSNRRLVLARDRVGVRPLHFAVLHGHGVLFASDIQSLLQDPGIPRDWCAEAIDMYLALGYIPAPLTAYRHISKLQPAHFLVVEGRRLHVEEYWDFPTASRARAPRDLTVAVNASLASAIRRITARRADTPVLYSGGTASSSLIAVAETNGVAITADIDQDATDLIRSDAAATHLGRTRELERITEPTASLIEELSAATGEPIADPSAITQLAVCKAAAKHAGVALSAHGANVLWASRPTTSRGGSPVTTRCGLWRGQGRRSIYTRTFAWQVRETNPLAQHMEHYSSRATGRVADRLLYVDTRTELPDNTLMAADRAATAAGMSLRYPFLDEQMVELAMSTPQRMKQRRGTAMYALRQLLTPHLPARLLPPARPRRPRCTWLRDALRTFVPTMLLAPRFDSRGIVSRPALRQLWHEHLASRADHSRRLWALLMLEFWFRDHIDGDAASEPLEYAVLLKAA